MQNVLLDGKEVLSETINPKEHRFIGQFRYPQQPGAMGADVIMCSGCKQALWTLGAVYDHYMMGHFDIMQYVSINCGENSNGL